MAGRDILPLYDAMIRLFAVSMPNDKISTQVLGQVLNIPRGTVKKVLATCPLPNGVQLTRGGHRGLEIFMTQPTFVAPLGRVELAMEIKKEKVWAEYGLTLPPHSEEIVVETGKVLDNIKKLKGSNIKKDAIIKNGDPKAYRVMWFAKDVVNGEWYRTVHEAITKKGRVTNKPTAIPRPVLAMPKLSPDLTERNGRPAPASPMEKYGFIGQIITFVADIQGLINSKDQYLAVIKNMEEKINREYPALIAQKEAEKAAAERDSDALRDRVKALNSLCDNQKIEIANLKKHPRFAGFVEKKK